MVQKPRRSRRRKKLLGSHQRCWIWGRFPVLETLRAGSWPVLELRLADRLNAADRAEAENLAGRSGAAVTVVPHEELTDLCGTTEHQGLAAKMPPYPYADPDSVLEAAGECPLVLILDAIQDPHNFGAILRSADALGISAVFVGKTAQAEVTSIVARSSAGAVNHVLLAQVDDLAKLVESLKSRRFQILGASEKEGTPADKSDFLKPTALLIGNEGVGIRSELLRLCDARVTIPQHGHVGSLNAAVSAGILLYEARRQRGISGNQETKQ